MSADYTVIASPYFRQSLIRLNRFLATKFSQELATQNNAALQQKIAEVLPKQPNIAPISERLIGLGISSYRQWAIDGNNLIYYRVDTDNKQVVLLLAMDARQDIQKLLYDLTLLA